MTGYIHSVESFGTVDGPGVRYVVFMQGCPLRCAYCHNPDTWELGCGTEMTCEDILSAYDKNKEFYSKGGITVTGGEPLVQWEFVEELFRLAKRKNIHTCIDTSGIMFDEKNPEKFDSLLEVCDLVMLDLKHIDEKKHKNLTGASNKNILAFARYLEKKNIPVWIRNVIVPGVTDSPDDLYELGKFIGSLKNVKALDALPYHTMGKAKYEEMGISYPLEGVEPPTKQQYQVAKEHILSGVRAVKIQQ